MANEAHIFPFFTKSGVKAENLDNLDSCKITLRGIVMERKVLNPDVPMFFNGRPVKEAIFYWRPIAQPVDFIQKGVKYTKSGLGFAKNKGPLDFLIQKKEKIN